MTVDIPHAARVCLDLLEANGLPHGAAVGVLGNFVAESGLNPAAVGDGGAAYGLCQWHPDRQKTLRTWAATHGLEPSALATQVRFAIYEAGTPDGGNCWTALRAITDDLAAAGLWMRKFERPADQSDAAALRRCIAGRRAAAEADKVPHTTPQPAPKPTPPPAHRVYVVKAGDTLSDIATRNRTSLATIYKLNPGLFDARHRGGDLIHPGETVKLP